MISLKANMVCSLRMEYTKPQKLPDGRYFLKTTKGGDPGARVLHQVNDVRNQEALDSRAVTFALPEKALEKFSGIDKEFIEQAKKNKVEWFNKEISDETLENAYQESVSDGCLQATLATVKGNVVTTAFDSKKQPLELQDIKADTPLDVLFELAGLWFLKKSFGPIWRVVQVRVKSVGGGPAFPKEYLFEDSEEEVEDPTDYVD
jgi:hypothetical protein